MVLQGITSDDGCSGRGKRRHMSTSSSAGGQQEAGRQEAALRELGIHAAWLPLLQAAPTGAMHVRRFDSNIRNTVAVPVAAYLARNDST